MKTFTFKYAPQERTRGDIYVRMLKAAKSGKPDVQENEMVCSSLRGLLEIASEPMLELMDAIVSERPESLYALAKKLGKDQAWVLREARVLAHLRLIELQESKTGNRIRLKPVPLYDRVVIDCGFGKRKKAVGHRGE